MLFDENTVGECPPHLQTVQTLRLNMDYFFKKFSQRKASIYLPLLVSC